MKIQGQITVREEKMAKTGQNYACFSVNGKKYNSWEMKINKDLKIGDLVEIETEKKGAFENVIAIRKIGKIEVQKIEPAKPAEFHLSIEEQRARALEIALKQFELLNIKPNTEQFLSIGKIIFSWISTSEFLVSHPCHKQKT